MINNSFVINFNNVYLKEVSTVTCLDEKQGPLGKLYDKTFDDYYIGEKTFEQSEMKMIKESVDIVLNKSRNLYLTKILLFYEIHLS